MTYAELQQKVTDWHAKCEGSRLICPPEAAVQNLTKLGMAVEEACDEVAASLDQLIRLEQLVILDGVPFADAQEQVDKEFNLTVTTLPPETS